ncbi:hypothetical protein GLOIN_2v1523055 [Rhizophagus clarus]|uniref:Uncharacterized protein n=1 Tax=Rhizophagus clarus TaxID=94130 RepID=A0A8H3LQE7_9GLOM|nr:hypothetical protein GLOIN_2v1523055 [Rhizophagus clarus]
MQCVIAIENPGNVSPVKIYKWTENLLRSDNSKKRTNKSVEKSSSKKAKKTGEKKVSENNPKRTAQALVNKVVRKQLPDSVSNDLLQKEKERALKIYDLFSEIGEHMIQRLEAENVKINAEKADIEDMYIELLKQIREEYTRRDAEKTEFKARIEELEKNITDTVVENAELGARINISNCSSIAWRGTHSRISTIFYEGIRGLELDAFFRHHRMALEVQEAQHRLHILAGIKMSKKLEDIVDRDRKKEPYVSLMEFIFLKYSTMRIRKSRFLRRYINLKSV